MAWVHEYDYIDDTTDNDDNAGDYVKQRRESTSMTMETIQHTLFKQETVYREQATNSQSRYNNCQLHRNLFVIANHFLLYKEDIHGFLWVYYAPPPKQQ